MRKGSSKVTRITGGHVSTSGNREMVKYRSPREGFMPSNGLTPGHPHPLTHPPMSLKGGGPGIQGRGVADTGINTYPGSRKPGRQVDNTRA